MLFYSQEAHEAAKAIADFAHTLNITRIVTPVNFHDARTNWLEHHAATGEFINPDFQYDQKYLKSIIKQSDRFTAAADVFYSRHSRDNPIRSLANRRLQETKAALDLAVGVFTGDSAKTTAASKQIFGFPDKNLTNIALTRVVSCVPRGPLPPDLAEEVDAETIKATFRQVLDQYGIKGWRCCLDRHASFIDARDYRSQIVIPADRRVTRYQLYCLIGHEIESHVRGSANTRALLDRHITSDADPFKLLINWLAKAYNETFYEGVAKCTDINTAHQLLGDGRSECPVPWYVLAAHIGQAADFATIAEEIFYLATTRAHQDEDSARQLAWRAAYRVKRGAPATSDKTYLFTKDCGYFAGHYAVALGGHSQGSDFSSLSIAEAESLYHSFNHPKPAYPFLGLAASYLERK